MRSSAGPTLRYSARRQAPEEVRLRAHSEDLPGQMRAVAEGVMMEKDPAEQEMLARGIGNELTEIFVGYVRGEYDFAEASFAAYDVLEDLHAIATGDYELEEDGDIDDEYDVDEATEVQEDLAQEPAR
jgi:hypothetical protein